MERPSQMKSQHQIMEEEEEHEVKWDYRLLTKKERRRFVQKKMIIQDNYQKFVKNIKNQVNFKSFFLI